MKRKLALLLTALLVFTTAACSADNSSGQPATSDNAGTESTDETETAGGEKETEKNDGEDAAEAAAASNKSGGWTIGIANREITNDYNRLIAYGAQDILEAAGCEVIMTDAETDFQKHNENIETLLNSGIDALIIQLGDNEQLAPLCEKAKEKGIPVVTAGIGSHIDNTICDTNADDGLAAVLLADAIFSGIDYAGDVYIFYVPGAPLLENRLAVIQGVAAAYPNINLVPVATEHNVSKVQTQMEELLTANPEKGSIAAVIGTYDSLITGAVESVRQADRSEIVMGGIDGDEVSFQMLFTEGSPFQVSVVIDASSIGATAANTVLGVLDGSIDPATVAAKIPTACYCATRRNGAEAAEMKWGTEIWEKINMSREEVEAAYPQNDNLLVCYPTVP
ncbi:MAG: substrate-binding domain-containing protein [Lachnospiraceae bacterium]|nr:substrate-binding domain-containing protein [Lachnospiraceae bacterium]MCI9341506.1 substrate-binding domain-containing protein [Lachnospiraceae bacterium]